MTKIESRKCLPLMYQLAARLGTKSHDNPLFQSTLNEVCSLLSITHCHDSLHLLLNDTANTNLLYLHDFANTNLNKGLFIKTSMDVEFFDLARLCTFTQSTELLTRDHSDGYLQLWKVFLFPD